MTIPRRVFVLFLACLVLPSDASTSDNGSALEVSLATFNIRYGTADDGPNSWHFRTRMVTDQINAMDADVLGLQEALRFQLDQIAEACPQYTEIGVGRDDGKTRGESTSILIRTDRFMIDRSGTFWLSETPDVVASKHWGNGITRICTFARLIDRETGHALWVYNAHFDHRSQPSRARAAELIAARISAHSDEPTVLMGDFNAGESNPAMGYLRGELDRASDARTWPDHVPVASPGLVDTYRALFPDRTEVGTFNGFTIGRTKGEKIDHVFASPGAEVVGAAIDRTIVDGRYTSDHFAVSAIVRFSGR